MKFGRASTEYHQENYPGGGDTYALCGLDIMGDTNYKKGVESKKEINCPQCLSLIRYCKKLP